jgi:hypothetical protein
VPLDFLQYLFSKGTVRIVTPVFGRIVSSSKAIRKLLSGLVGERLCFLAAL